MHEEQLDLPQRTELSYNIDDNNSAFYVTKPVWPEVATALINLLTTISP